MRITKIHETKVHAGEESYKWCTIIDDNGKELHTVFIEDKKELNRRINDPEYNTPEQRWIKIYKTMLRYVKSQEKKQQTGEKK